MDRTGHDLEMRPLAMRLKNIVSVLVLIAILLLALAWYDGGERPMRQITRSVAVPGDFK